LESHHVDDYMFPYRIDYILSSNWRSSCFHHQTLMVYSTHFHLCRCVFDSRWTFLCSRLRCWLPNLFNFQTFTFRLVSFLRCSLNSSKGVPAIKEVLLQPRYMPTGNFHVVTLLQ